MISQPNKTRRLVRAILIDLAVLGVCLYGFCYFHFLKPTTYSPTALSTPVVSSPPTAEPTVTPEQSAQPEATSTPEPTPEVVDTGLLNGSYAEKFTTGEVISTDSGYQSANVSVEMTTVTLEEGPVVYHVAEIFIKDISSFRTTVAAEYKEINTSADVNTMSALQMAQLSDAIVAVSGDYFGARRSGLIAVRNGVEWFKRLPLERDICVLYYDGTLVTYAKKTTTSAVVEEIYANNPYQIWTFGPALVVDGEVPASFGYDSLNPLCGIGYVEPGHYFFITVDGRQKASDGMNYSQLAQVFYELGCVTAYNLDGGKTTAMIYQNELYSVPQDGGTRSLSDIIYIGEPGGSDAASTPGE